MYKVTIVVLVGVIMFASMMLCGAVYDLEMEFKYLSTTIDQLAKFLPGTDSSPCQCPNPPLETRVESLEHKTTQIIDYLEWLYGPTDRI